MQTAQEKHPIHQTIKRATNSRSGRHISTFEYLTRSFPELIKPLEMIKPYACPPQWTPPLESEIAINKKFAKQAHDQTLQEHTHSASIQMAPESTGTWGLLPHNFGQAKNLPGN